MLEREGFKVADRIEGELGGSGSPKISAKTIIALVIAVLALIFVFQNTGHANVRFLFLEIGAPGWVWFLVLFLAGVVVGSMFPWLRKKKKK